MTIKPIDPSNVVRDASLSPCLTWRYHLSRVWGGASSEMLVYLMCNPSKADASIDDHTIRKCMGFAQRLGYEGIEVINLFAYRSTNPDDLIPRIGGTDLFGPDYDHFLKRTVAHAKTLVCAWGCDSTLRKSDVLLRRPAEVLQQIREINPVIQIKCFGKTKFGTPRHPLMLPYNTPLVDIDMSTFVWISGNPDTRFIDSVPSEFNWSGVNS